MALITAAQIATLAVALLKKSIVLPATVERVADREYAGPNGSTVNVRVRGVRTAHEQATPGSAITLDDVNETPVPVTVHHAYGTRLTDHDLTLNLVDFGTQFVEPSVTAVAAKAEKYLADTMNGVTADESLTAPDGAAWAAAIKDAGLALDVADVDPAGRTVAVSPQVARALLDVEAIENASAYGNPDAVQNATIGRYSGFTLVKSNQLTAGSMVAYHRSAFVFASRPPVLPGGGVDAAIHTDSGLSLRVVRDFDASTLSQICATSVFAGAALLDVNRVYRVTTGA